MKILLLVGSLVLNSRGGMCLAGKASLSLFSVFIYFHSFRVMSNTPKKFSGEGIVPRIVLL